MQCFAIVNQKLESGIGTLYIKPHTILSCFSTGFGIVNSGVAAVRSGYVRVWMGVPRKH